MRIIIAGAGAVGTHLAKMLAREDQDIVLLDEDEERLEGLESNYDLMTKVGKPTSLEVLNECGVDGVDLFVAVTPQESINMTACMLATNLGAKKTVARIENSEYLKPQNSDFFKQLGVNTLILPERLAANGIVDILKTAWMREIRYFCNELLVTLCVKVREGAPIVDKKFSSGYFNQAKYRIVAIKRHSKTIIPKGDDEVKAGDIVYFITTEENMEHVRYEAGKDLTSVKRIMFMGGGHIARLAIKSLPKDIKVTVIEKNIEQCRLLSELNRDNTLIIKGDGRDADFLKLEGIESVDAFVAVTDNSEANTLACLTAKDFGIRKCIAQIENIDYIDIADHLDIGTIINKKLIAASYIYQQTLDADVLNVQCLTYSDAEVVEYVVNENDKITRKKVRELGLPEEVNIGGIVRDGKGLIVNGDIQLQAGDHVVIFCTASSVRKIDKFFS